MILEGAPVTGLTLLISTVSSTMVRGQYTRYRNMAFAPDTLAAPLTCFALAKRLLLQSIPIGPLGISFRTLERRWGSNTYMAFLFTSAVLGVCTVQLFVTESGSKQLSIDAVRILSAAGTIVPSRSTLAMRIPGTNLIISEKALTLLPLMKLVLSPSTQLQAQTFRRAAVEADVGVWTRLWLALVGAIFAIMSTRSHVVRWWLTPRNARHHQGGNGSFQLGIGGARAGFDGADDAGVVDGGRYVVESLTGGDTLQEVRARMRARRHGAQQQQQGSRGGAVAAGAPAQARRRSPQEETARNEAIATIEAIGLRASRDEIIAALDMTGGNLEMAVQILLGN
ncbi:UBA/TS-N domain family protein [Leishmania donovani]|uniref:UBA/TS-N domain family protein n=1 Tax=Leishmania donovani TaxID=5661 RepID=A0A504X7C3_LEIDO|nr:UBA/TS-N domain family protein [Leishmania donovani]